MNKYVRRATGAKKETIPFLLDIEHFYGQSEGRLTPFILTITIGGAPAVLYVYFGLFNVIPLWLFIPFNLLVLIRAAMIILGRESYRLDMYRRSLYDDYIGTANLVNIRTIHSGNPNAPSDQDGLVEYTNGTIAYYLLAYNGTIQNDDQHAISVKHLLESIIGDRPFDIHVLNDNQTSNLYEYYKKIQNFEKNEAATNFVKIIDYCRNEAMTKSMIQAIVIVLKGKKSDWKEMSVSIKNALASNDAKAFKSLKLLTTDDEIGAIINRDTDTIVNINELLRRKYRTGDYGDSKVLKFNATNKETIHLGVKPEEALLPKSQKSTFHVRYDTEELVPDPYEEQFELVPETDEGVYN